MIFRPTILYQKKQLPIGTGAYSLHVKFLSWEIKVTLCKHILKRNNRAPMRKSQKNQRP